MGLPFASTLTPALASAISLRTCASCSLVLVASETVVLCLTPVSTCGSYSASTAASPVCGTLPAAALLACSASSGSFGQSPADATAPLPGGGSAAVGGGATTGGRGLYSIGSLLSPPRLTSPVMS